MTYIRPKFDYQKFTVVHYSDDPGRNINEQLQWLGSSLGLFNLRDKDSSCFRIFIELIKDKQGMTAEDLSKRVALSRATTIHHLNKLIDSGIVVYKKGTYVLAKASLTEVLDDIEEQTQKTLLRMKAVAKHVDERI